jgi:phosphatidylglycerol lysyltransferase
MAFQTKKALKKALSWAGLFFFGVAAYMLYRQLSKYSLDDIKEALLAIPGKNFALACAASFMGYVALSSYDYLALRYIGRKLAPWKWIFAGFIGFSVSNNAGHAIVSGGTIRYRLYTRWRFRGTEIVKMVTFSGFTYLVACFFLIIVGYLITPDHAFGAGSVSKLTTEIVALVSLVGLIGYFGLSLYYKKPLVIKDIEFDMPRFPMALAQVFIGAIDILMASLVLYFSLIASVQIPFSTFMGVFIIAQVLGVFSQVPGGLGVFEGLFMYIIPGEHNQAMLFGALLAYRIIYYLLPLVVSAIVLFSYEGYLKYVKKQQLERYRLFRMHEVAKQDQAK